MLIGDLCRECRLTKKAIEYYEGQGLIFPVIGDNGYRHYSGGDVSTLKEISLLRKLNISVIDIKIILASSNKAAAIAKCKYKMDLEVEKALSKKKCLEQLMENYNIDEAMLYMDKKLDGCLTIREKLLLSFPGTYGMFLSVHFGQFLKGEIDTAEKAEAYEKIINFLDNLKDIDLPAELEDYLLQNFQLIKETDMESISTSLVKAVDNMDLFLEENKDTIQAYLKFRKSEEYKNSLLFKFQKLMTDFMNNSGYYDILIPNLKILSDSYREYTEKLHSANEQLVNAYPEVESINLVNFKGTQ